MLGVHCEHRLELFSRKSAAYSGQRINYGRDLHEGNTIKPGVV